MTELDRLARAFSGRRVLVTGHTGFKGSWLSLWLLELGADVSGYALEPDTTPSLFADLDLANAVGHHAGDVRDADAVSRVVSRVRPEVVFHLAAQPLVRRGYDQPIYTLQTNVLGTANVLESVRECSATRALVNITTDKVYENPESGHEFVETDPLGGQDPYSASKACSEIVTACYRESFLTGRDAPVAVATARAGNVIGGGDWAADRILPDIARALLAGGPVEVRNPDSIRPWQHVLEPLFGYLMLAARLQEDGRGFASAYNFGPIQERRTVRDVVERAIAEWGSGSWNMPPATGPHEAKTLRLDVHKAERDLGWTPVWGFEETIARTVRWYSEYGSCSASASQLCATDIEAFRLAVARGRVGSWN